MALDYGVPEVNSVLIMHDGLELSSVPKPFITVQYRQNISEEQAAGRDSYFDTYSFQVGVFARDVNELFKLESKVRKVIRDREGHPLFAYDEETGGFEQTDKLLPFYDVGFTPIGSDDSSDSTFMNHGYFDVDIEHY